MSRTVRAIAFFFFRLPLSHHTFSSHRDSSFSITLLAFLRPSCVATSGTFTGIFSFVNHCACARKVRLPRPSLRASILFFVHSFDYPSWPCHSSSDHHGAAAPYVTSRPRCSNLHASHHRSTTTSPSEHDGKQPCELEATALIKLPPRHKLSETTGFDRTRSVLNATALIKLPPRHKPSMRTGFDRTRSVLLTACVVFMCYGASNCAGSLAGAPSSASAP